jgi:hypothetical protein
MSSELKGNSAGGNGGGVFDNGVTLTLANSTIAGNITAASGGGVEIETSGTGAASSVISSTTITGNAALNNGGGNLGGGVDVGNGGAFAGVLTLANDTINANFAVSGGGLAMASGGTVDVQNTIIAQNRVTGSGTDFVTINGTHLTSQGGNLVGVNNNGDTTFNQTGDQAGNAANPVDPLLGPLQNNGGPTVGAAGSSLVLETEALLTGSPAIARGLTTGATGDERGFLMPANTRIDVGAFQTGAVAAGSMVSLVASVPSPVVGQSVTLTATVSALQAGATTGTPIGTVVFMVDGVAAGSSPLDGTGKATLVLTAGLSTGPHTVMAVYSGGGSYATSSTTLAIQVGQAGSSTQLFASANSVAFGQPAVFTAIVAAVAPGVAAPTGMVSFFDGNTLLGSSPVLSGGQAVFATSALGTGPHMVTAMFGGNGNLTGSTSTAVALTVTKAVPSVALVASTQQVLRNQPITLVAVVTGPVNVAPSGTVTLFDNGAPVGTAMLTGGVAVFTTSHFQRGANVFTATYGGDGNYQGGRTHVRSLPRFVVSHGHRRG